VDVGSTALILAATMAVALVIRGLVTRVLAGDHSAATRPPPIRLIVVNQAGAPSSWNLVRIRSGSMALTCHPLLRSNAALSSS
jgi:hypothetical protein